MPKAPPPTPPMDQWELFSRRIHQAWTSLRRPWQREGDMGPTPFDDALFTDFGGTSLVTVFLHEDHEGGVGKWSTWAEYQVETEDQITFFLKHKPTLTIAKNCIVAIDRAPKKAIVASAFPAKHS